MSVYQPEELVFLEISLQDKEHVPEPFKNHLFWAFSRALKFNLLSVEEMLFLHLFLLGYSFSEIDVKSLKDVQKTIENGLKKVQFLMGGSAYDSFLILNLSRSSDKPEVVYESVKKSIVGMRKKIAKRRFYGEEDGDSVHTQEDDY